MKTDLDSCIGCFLPNTAAPPAMVIHGSAVNTNKGALAFLGQSGAGKSSIVELLTTHPDYQFIADDLIALSYIDDTWLVQNGEHHLADSLANNGIRNHNGVPIVGFMLLNQAQQPRSVRVSQSDFAMRLMNAVLEIVGHSTGYNACKALRWFYHMGKVADTVPCWHLHFSLSSHTISHISSMISNLSCTANNESGE